MNLLCPNCQKMLTVPEEFAGQLMKCPLCSSNFTVPGLPESNPASPHATGSEPDIYSVRHEPPQPTSPPPLSDLPPPPSAATTTSLPPPSTLTPQEHQHAMTAYLNPQLLPWIAPVCLLTVFFLQFMDWDGLYPGGEPAVTGNAWRAAFGAYEIDGDLKSLVRPLEDEKFKPGASILTIFYLFLFFLALLVTIASVALPLLQIKLPPQVEKLMPWRWVIVAALNLVVLLFLGLQTLLGFSLDSRYSEWVDKEMKSEVKDNPTTQERKLEKAHRGQYLEMLRHTFALRLVVLLHLVASLCAILMVWIDRHGPHRPLPKLEMRW